jgi:hypothetical protein
MTVKLPERIFLFEFKVVELVPEGRALTQLQDKGYADKYRAAGLPLVLIGVEFSRIGRNVVGFESREVSHEMSHEVSHEMSHEVSHLPGM